MAARVERRLAAILAAVRRGSVFDHTVMGISLTGYSMPIFWWGLLLIILFGRFPGRQNCTSPRNISIGSG